jgi:DNA replication ATP-dependent helicase Dna2
MPVALKLNDREAHAAAELARALVASGVPPEEIGVIAPFRAQAARLRQHAGDLVERGLTVDTVDRFQGGERRVILLSLTAAAPPSEEMAAFLSDPRRLNVALTRAREKLIILGNRAAVANLPFLGDLAAHCADLVMPWQ